MSQIKLVSKPLFYKAVEAFENSVCAIGLIGISLMVFAGVLNRYWLHLPIMGLGDLALSACVLFLLFSIVSATGHGDHVAVEAFHERVLREKPRAIAIHRVCIGIIPIALVCTFLPSAYAFMLQALRYPEYSILWPWFNYSWQRIAFSIAFALILLLLLVVARRDIVNLVRVWRSRPQH